MTTFTFPCSSYLITENLPHNETLRDTIDLPPYCKSHEQKQPTFYLFLFSANILFYVGLVSNCLLIRSGESHRCFDTLEREAAVLFSWCGLNNRTDRCWYNCAPGTHCLAAPPQSHTRCVSMPPPPVHYMAESASLAVPFMHCVLLFWWPGRLHKNNYMMKIKKSCSLIHMLFQEFSKNVHAFLFHTS